MNEKLRSKEEFIRKSAVSVPQIKYYLATGVDEAIYKIPLTTVLSIEDIITIKGALNKIKFYGKGGLIVNDKINEYLIEALETACKKENFRIKVQVPTNKYGLNRKAWIAKLLCIQDLVCNKTNEVFDKEVHDATFYSAGVVDIEEIEYTDYTIKPQFKGLRIVTAQFESVIVGCTYNIKSKVAGKTRNKIVRSTPIGEQLHIPFEIDGIVYTKEKIKNFFKVKPIIETDFSKSKYDIEKDIWTILNSTKYSYKDIMAEDMAEKLISKVFSKLCYSSHSEEALKLKATDIEKATLIAVNYLLDCKEDIIQYFDTEAVAEIIEELDDQSTVYFGKQNYFESEVYDDSNYQLELEDAEVYTDEDSNFDYQLEISEACTYSETEDLDAVEDSDKDSVEYDEENLEYLLFKELQTIKKELEEIRKRGLNYILKNKIQTVKKELEEILIKEENSFYSLYESSDEEESE